MTGFKGARNVLTSSFFFTQYASFADMGVGQTVPYSVSVDHSNRRVVVAVRGELTLADAISVGSMVPAPLAPHAKQWGFQVRDLSFVLETVWEFLN
jgi:hypothetical protein